MMIVMTLLSSLDWFACFHRGDVTVNPRHGYYT